VARSSWGFSHTSGSKTGGVIAILGLNGLSAPAHLNQHRQSLPER
jgi:hypothetical protein